MPRTNLAVRVASAVFRIAGEMCQLPAYFDNPDDDDNNNNNDNALFEMQNNGSDRLKRLSGINPWAYIYSIKSVYNKIVINT